MPNPAVGGKIANQLSNNPLCPTIGVNACHLSVNREATQTNESTMILRNPLYPWLLALHPIVHLYAENLGLVLVEEVAPTILGVLAATTVVYALASRWIDNQHKRAFYLSIGIALFSLSGHGYISLFMPRSLLVWNAATLAFIIVLAYICNRYIPQSVYARLTAPFNIAGGVLMAMQIVATFASLMTTRGSAEAISNYAIQQASQTRVAKIEDSAAHPDIYYIIPDGYPSDAWLLSAINYDNTAFTAALEERGFVVVDSAKSNYGKTLLSLASALNMRYFTSNPSILTDLDYLRLAIANSETARFLLQKGYMYINMLSGYLIPSQIADINLDFSPAGLLSWMYRHRDTARALLERRKPTIPPR